MYQNVKCDLKKSGSSDLSNTYNGDLRTPSVVLWVLGLILTIFKYQKTASEPLVQTYKLWQSASLISVLSKRRPKVRTIRN